MQGGALTVISCFFDQPITAATPVNLEQPEEADELLQIAAEALAEIDDLKVQLLLMRNPQPARAIVQEPQKEKIDFLCAGMNSGLPKESQVNRLVLRLLRFAPCNMFVLDPRDADGSRYENILLPMEVGSYFGKDSKEVAQRSLISELQQAGIKESTAIKPIRVLSGEKWKSAVSRSRGSDLVLTSAAAVREVRKFRQEEKRHTDPKTPKIPIGRVRRWNVESKSSWIGMIESQVFSWLPSLEAVDRVDLFDRLQAGARWNVDYILMMCLSTAIASLGLMQNSTAVVIGAMVVAPLMTPLIDAGLSLIQGNLIFFRDAMRAMGYGIAAS